MIDLSHAVMLLRELDSNNSRDWYQANKADIQKGLLDPGQAACAELRLYLEAECGVKLASKIYRLNRDLRFSKDKTPYNPHFRFSLWEAEFSQESSVCFHFSVETNRLTMGVGLWEFKERLSGFRDQCAELGSLLTREMRLSEPELKRVPSGVIASPELEEHFRRKGLTVWIDNEHDDAGQVAFNVTKLRSLVPIYQWLKPL